MTVTIFSGSDIPFWHHKQILQPVSYRRLTWGRSGLTQRTDDHEQTEPHWTCHTVSRLYGKVRFKIFKAYWRGTDIQNPQLEVHGSFPPCKVIFSKTHLTLATWETGPATPWCLEPAYERAWMFKLRKWKLAMQGLTIRYMLQNVCQIRCKYESHVILLFCFMASRGIFGRQGLACMTDIDQETFLGAFIILSFYFIFIFPLLRWTLCFSLSIICIYETKIKSEILKLLSFFAVIGRFMLSLDLMNFRKSGARVQKLLSDKEEEECVFSVAFSS